MSATALLPLAIPPVSAMSRGRAFSFMKRQCRRALPPGQLALELAQAAHTQVRIDEPIAPQQRDPAGTSEIRAEWNRNIPVPATERDQRDTDDRAGDRGQEDDHK